jgi:cell pole-organizing protein PopZ
MPRLSAESAPSLVEAPPEAEDESPDELLLTEMLDDDGSVVSLSEASPPAPRPIGPGEPAVERLWHEPAFSRPAEEPTLRRPEEPALAVARAASQQLMSQDRAQASAALLRELVRSVTQAKELSLGGNPTLEALIREALHPLLRDWLDANLPALVERLVRAEIARVVARAEDDTSP